LTPADLERIRDRLASVPATQRHAYGTVRVPFRDLESLVAEVAEHRAARGIDAPPGWQPSVDALWEREVPGQEDGGLVVLEDHYYEKPWRWAWYVGGGKVRAEGTCATCLGAIAAAEAALTGGSHAQP
jgi:hypothetical protein